MKFRSLLFLFGVVAPIGSALEQACSADGTCMDIQENVVIPNSANTEGAAPKLAVDCVDRHANCVLYTEQNQCTENPGWMIVNCPHSCNACHLRDRDVRCSKDFLNMTDLPPAFAENGDLDATFTRIVAQYGKEMGITVHSEDPWVLTFDNFMSSEEADALVATVHTWERSTDTGAMNAHGETGRKLSTGRTSSNAWCRKACEDDPHVQNIIRRIETITSIPFDNSESFQILRYENGQKYNAHHDSSMSQNRLPCGPRVLTFYFYLSDVEEGGQTAFPNLNIAVTPKKGRAILWPGIKNENPKNIDQRTLHEARPVIQGTKYGANAWIHMYNFRTPNLWGCTGSFD